MITPTGPQPLAMLFLIDKKQELINFCKTITITGQDIYEHRLACEGGLLPWHHHFCHQDMLPTGVELTDSEADALSLQWVEPSNPKTVKAMNKLRHLFDVRRYFVGHLFYSYDHLNWHLLYFDQRDIDNNTNHWEHGSHIHLINYLWPNYDLQSVFNATKSNKPHFSKSLHIRFSDSQSGT